MRIRCSTSWLWLLVALQVAIPASYYLGRGDRDDERFAWRMFSAIRLKRCEVEAFDHEPRGSLRPIAIARALHASWARSLERGRTRVIRSFLAGRCALPGVAQARLERRCEGPSGRAFPREQYRYDCAADRFEVAP